ncbi:MAG: hypothetical protein N3E40_07190, partial [Dehalococcoidia bacterium]|nr:hypothetical protein [Dehalococcoidia bacterium]
PYLLKNPDNPEILAAYFYYAVRPYLVLAEKVICCPVAEHHNETLTMSALGFIVATADAISGSRLGARHESVEQYLKRIEDLEHVATSFPGVEKAYAIQAGREVRIMVKPESVDDLGVMRLARDIVKKIEETLAYPGQIKVTVVRETRAVDYAK